MHHNTQTLTVCQSILNVGRDLKSAFKNTTSLWESDRVSSKYRHGGSQESGYDYKTISINSMYYLLLLFVE